MQTILKKTSLTLILFLIFNCQVRAQWVTIPDANFVAYLQQNFPGCMNGNLMDTTCSGIVNAISVDCNYLGIHSIQGIEYFDALTSLSCYADSISTLPNLPTSITYLDFTGNQLSSLPSLPPNLLMLYCGYNQLTTLPPLPATLIRLFCNGNMLTFIPSLPNGMAELNCTYNQLTSLPSLGISLTDLNCGYNQLASLPVLPSTLNNLLCQNNQLLSLPILPTELDYLECSFNQLSGLPQLPDSLIFLNCNYNQLTTLPQLPSNLNVLKCRSNQLTNLPTLPLQLHNLDCAINQLSCLPFLPNTLTNPLLLSLNYNSFMCLPNYVAAMNGTAYLNYPLCFDNDSLNNPNSCIIFKGVSGITFKDINLDCDYNNGDQLARNIPVQLFDTGSTLISTFYSLNNGVYNYVLDSGIYTLQVDTSNKSYTINCSYPGNDSTVILTALNPIAQHINFELACKTGFDLGVKSVMTRRRIFPGMPHELQILAGDLSKWYNLNCASGISGNIDVIVNGPATFDSIPSGSLTPTTIAGNSLSYTISDFGALNLNSFAMWLTTDTSAQAGDQICVNVNITPTIGDNDATNNNYSYCYSVVNSFDPNDKQVYPTTVNPAYNDYFTYTINFQNIGTAAAQNIRVVDTLASNLDLSTFEIINYSHTNTSTLTGNVATFRFPNIQLADSTSNPELSKGFIQYRIKPLANLPFGTQIENKARIYFDFNAPILTNTAVSTYNNTVGLSPNPSPQERGVIVYPNPGKGIFNLSFSNISGSTKTIEVFNLIGEKVFSGMVKATNTVIDLANKPNGVYVLRVCDAEHVFMERIVKQ